MLIDELTWEKPDGVTLDIDLAERAASAAAYLEKHGHA